MPLIILFISFIIFFWGYRFYSVHLSKKFGLIEDKPTPAIEINDGVDYVPTHTQVVFAHHFASIAGTMPIIGPTIALIYGYIPAWLWIVFGAVFLGCVHDFSVLFVSIREKGKSIAQIINNTLGKFGFGLFIVFTLVMLLLVTSLFLNAAAMALTSNTPLEILNLPKDQTLLRTIEDNGVTKAIVGGIASTSVIIITICAPMIGYLLYKRKMKWYFGTLLALFICIASVVFGFRHPISMKPIHWQIILSIYTLFASGIAVWLILQPRDFINVHILYIGIFLLGISAIIAGLFKGLSFNFPGLNISDGTKALGWIWPNLFIVIGCGAVSGFHCLVAGGTTSKQLKTEKATRQVGYGAMLLEAILAILVVIVVATSLKDFAYYKTIALTQKNPILAFALGVGGILNNALNIPVVYGTIFGIIMIEGFIATTLDTAIRLKRYLFEELWNILFAGKVPFPLNKIAFNSALAVVLMFLLAYFNALTALVKIFGTANQLLASLALIAVSAWFFLKKRPTIYTLIPAIFISITTVASLIYLLVTNFIPNKNYPLAAIDILLFVLAIGVIIITVKFIRSPSKNTDKKEVST